MNTPQDFTCIDCGERFVSRSLAFQHIDANPTHGIGGTVFEELSGNLIRISDGRAFAQSLAFSDLYRELASAAVAWTLAEREEKRALWQCAEIRARLPLGNIAKPIHGELEIALALEFARKCGDIVTSKESQWKALARKVTAALEAAI